MLETSTTTGSKDSKTCESLDKRRLQRIFTIMQTHYGTRWVNQVGSFELVDGESRPSDRLRISFEVWGKKLAGLSDKQIMRGLDSLPEDFPPSPPAFYKLCTGIGEGLTTNTAAYRSFKRSRAIENKPDKELSRKKGRQAIDYAKQLLGR